MYYVARSYWRVRLSINSEIPPNFHCFLYDHTKRETGSDQQAKMWRNRKPNQNKSGGHDGGAAEQDRRPLAAECFDCLLTGASFHRLDLLLATMELRVVSCTHFPRKLHVQNDTHGFVCKENKSHEVPRTGSLSSSSLSVF